MLLGRSAYQPPAPNAGMSEADETSLRRALGGQLQMPGYTQSRWYAADVETAEHNADTGDLALAGRLMSAARRDGVLSGVLSTRTAGIVRLPRRFKGDAQVANDLDVGRDSVRSVFDEMFPPSELALLTADGLMLGVGVGELIPVQGRDYPVFTRLDPQYLQYVWTENQWYYRSIIGRLPITPGDGRWILHTPGGRVAPWQNGIWRALSRDYIRKEHANWQKDNWEAKLANPARVAQAPAGSSEAQKDSFFKQIMAWGLNSVFGLPLGYEVKLLESNGRGADSFVKTIADCNTSMIITIAGQTVTTDGGAGFQNSDIHRTIRADLIKATADDLAYTMNTQGIPVFVALRYGRDAVLTRPCIVEWDVTPPKDRNAEAQSLVTVSNAITGLTSALTPTPTMVLDVARLCEQFAVPTAKPKPQPLRLVGGTDADGDPTKNVQDTALNGAQVASLLQVVIAVAQGQLPRDAALGIIKRAFKVDDAGAAEMLGSAGTDAFTPAAPAPAAAPAPVKEAA